MRQTDGPIRNQFLSPLCGTDLSSFLESKISSPMSQVAMKPNAQDSSHRGIWTRIVAKSTGAQQIGRRKVCRFTDFEAMLCILIPLEVLIFLIFRMKAVSCRMQKGDKLAPWSAQSFFECSPIIGSAQTSLKLTFGSPPAMSAGHQVFSYGDSLR